MTIVLVAEVGEGHTARNIAIAIGRAWAHVSTLSTTGTAFDIFVYGTGRLR